MPASGVEPVGNHAGRATLPTQVMDRGHDLVEPAQLLEPLHRANNGMAGPRAAGLLVLDFNVFAGPFQADDNPLEDEPGNGLAVPLRRRRGMPERWYVLGELPNGGQFRHFQSGQLTRQFAGALGFQGFLCCERPLPLPQGATALQSLSPAPIKRDPCTKVGSAV